MRAKGRMTSVTIPHFVPPSAIAASHASRGAWDITSRLTDVTMGMIMMPTTTPQTKIELPKVASGSRNNGMKLACTLSHFVNAVDLLPEHLESPEAVEEARKHRQEVHGRASSIAWPDRGAYSLINSAADSETGTPTISAIAAIITVPTSDTQ